MSATTMTGRIKSRPSATISCEECGREFQRNRKADLQRHMRIHTNEKPFACEFPNCGKAFRQSSALKNHQNFHTKEKPYKCELCDQSFFDKPTCNRHRKEKHELQHVYKCSTCDRLFKRKSVFKAHMKEKHRIDADESHLNSCRVSADSYTKSSSSTRSSHYTTNNTALPKLSDALQGVRAPQMPPLPSNYYTSNPASYAATTQNPVYLRSPYGQPSMSSRSNYGRYPGSGSNPWMQSSSSQAAMYQSTQIMSASAQPNAFLGIGPGSSSANYSPPSSTYSLSPHSSLVSSSGSSSGSMGSYSPNSSFDRSVSSSPIGQHPELIGGPSYVLKPATDYSVNYLLTGTPY